MPKRARTAYAFVPSAGQPYLRWRGVADRRPHCAPRAPRACTAEDLPRTQPRRAVRHDTQDAGALNSRSDGEFAAEVHGSIGTFDAAEWDALARGGSGSPFLRHAFLRALEGSGCACADSGWTPRHVSLRDATGNIVAVAPAYSKTHSLGEFVFDQQWAEASFGAGIRYYPKLLLAVPFTPATGRRILTSHAVDKSGARAHIVGVFAQALVRICDALGACSVHVNFCEADEADALAEAGFMRRQGTQYHFENCKKGGEEGVGEMYADFEDYLSEFRAKRRGNIRRERRAAREESGLTVEVVSGRWINEGIMDDMFEMYKATIDKLFWGRQYLNRRFFRMLLESDEFRERLCFVLARRQNDGRIIAGTFNVVGENNGAFYGRYWGCSEEHRYLHFETCYYAAIEYCIDNQLARMEPGAGGGDFKYMRGFEPAVTLSMHYIRDKRLARAVQRFLTMETEYLDEAVEDMRKDSAIRAKEKKNGKREK